ncbi:MAG TPA: acyl-CoA dehydrogenase family protein, partial [Usitatibacter sp.]|nr:acyl-CoA dehydrogenase family protein [Usitatibacter sp.]
MNFDLNEEQQMLADSVRRFIKQDYTFENRKAIVASEPGYSPGVWKTFAELGLLALPIPTEHGGFGGTAVDLMPVMEAFGEALVVEPYLSTVMCAHMLGHPGRAVDDRHPGRANGATARGPILSAVAEGRMILAFAHSEDGARYDLNHVAVTAKRDGDGFTIDGLKRVVLNGPQADRLLVSARTSGAATDESGISLFVVDPQTAGITMRAYRTIDGFRAADIAFDGVRVRADA